jgi:preprotein translocase subunit SecA
MKRKWQTFKRKIAGDHTQYSLKRFAKDIGQITDQRKNLSALSDTELMGQSRKLKEQVLKGRHIDELMVPAFVLVKEVIRRKLGLIAYEEQMIAAIVMLEGKIAQMQTGEGKTLAAVFALYLSALTGEGVHLLTANDYLAKRDAQWMGDIYRALGLTVGFIQQNMDTQQRIQAYACDITYLTASQAGFDLLRDGMCNDHNDLVHRKLNFAIIDEADSIMLDQARNPLVIAKQSEDRINDTVAMVDIARKLVVGSDVEIAPTGRDLQLTESGVEVVETLLGCDNLYEPTNYEQLCLVNDALHAEYLLENERDYVVQQHCIRLIDENTGRIVPDQRLSDGLQAALEAKEGLPIQNQGEILNSITLTQLVFSYPKFAGMTATAQLCWEEFESLYGTNVVVIPTHRPSIRIDHPDRLFCDKATRDKVLISHIIKEHHTGRPILVGTASVAESNALADALKMAGMGCQVLNADNDELEAQIIAKAGEMNAITISTNMAGRGTDIKLGNENIQQFRKTARLGGLLVIGTQRHESERIDLQLRGRAGRQGEPGASQFFISADDSLFIKYATHEMSVFAKQCGEDGEITAIKAIDAIAKSQRIAQGHCLDIKTNLNRYTTLLEQQRRILSMYRWDILNEAVDMADLNQVFPNQYEGLCQQFDESDLQIIYRRLQLKWMDDLWSGHLAQSNEVQQGIQLRVLGGDSPLTEFNKWAVGAFEQLLLSLGDGIAQWLDSLSTQEIIAEFFASKRNLPSATWTYLANDQLYDDLHDSLLNSAGVSVAAATNGGLFLLLYLLARKWSKRSR